MSATFDATTTAEYAAATTAAARSAVIVAALTGTISVKVFDGSNVEKGSGTMDSPWATALDNVVTIGEVTSFTVGTTATPDANWYIRFQNAGATRWLRASFNLTGADFTWSLNNWTATHTGTIGTATITTSGNAAPVFTVAPTSASLPATGGTIQFTAVDPDGGSVVYGLSTTRFGITINLTNGLVGVTEDAAATSGRIDVTATDGILTTTTSCDVTVASAETYAFDNGFEDIAAGALQQNPNYVDDNWRLSNDADEGFYTAEISTAISREGSKSYHTRLVRNGLTTYRQEMKAIIPSVAALSPPASLDYWIGISIYIPTAANLATSHIVMQWHANNGSNSAGPPLLLSIANTGWRWEARYGLILQTTGIEWTEYSTEILRDQWTDWVACIRWDYRTAAQGGQGRVRVWKNEGTTPIFDRSGRNCYSDDVPLTIPYLKVGDYSSLWKFAAAESPDGTIHEQYHDAVRVAMVSPSASVSSTLAAMKPRGSRT